MRKITGVAVGISALIVAGAASAQGMLLDAAADKVIKKYQARSPRGPFRIDPETRDAINDIYIRRVERADGRLVNAVIDTIPAVKDPWKQRNKP